MFSGPISKDGPEGVQKNIDILRDVGYELIKRGYTPFVPSAFLRGAGEILSHEEWLDCDLPWVDVSDALLRVPGDSKGADEEVEYALASARIPVFTSIEELDAWRKAGAPVKVKGWHG